MENNSDQLTNEARQKLEATKGLKRLDKLFAQKQSGFAGVHFSNQAVAASIFENLISLQNAGIDLAIINISGTDLHAFFENMKNFRQQVYMPVLLELPETSVREYEIEKFCQHLASVALDGFTSMDIDLEKYTKDYKGCVEKYGLSYTFQLQQSNVNGQLEAVDKVANAFIIINDVENIAGANLVTKLRPLNPLFLETNTMDVYKGFTFRGAVKGTIFKVAGVNSGTSTIDVLGSVIPMNSIVKTSSETA